MTVNFNKSGIVKAENFQEIIQLSDGSKWLPICIHNVNGGNNLFSSSDDFTKVVYHNSEIWADFSKIGTVSRPESNYYEILVKQQAEINGAWSIYRFKQTVNPLTATWDTCGPTSGATTWITGGDSSHGGMYVLNSNIRMCFSNSSNGNWFGCGSWTEYQGGIPSVCSTVCRGWQLVYIRIANAPTQILKCGIVEVSDIIEN